jgi:hypothetical protein
MATNAATLSATRKYLDRLLTKVCEDEEVLSRVKFQPLMESLLDNHFISYKRYELFNPCKPAKAQARYLAECLRFGPDDFMAFAQLCTSLADSGQHEVLYMLDPFLQEFPELRPVQNVFPIAVSNNVQVVVFWSGGSDGQVLVSLTDPKEPSAPGLRLTEPQFLELLNASRQVVETDRGKQHGFRNLV